MKVLIADDDRDLRDLIAFTLTQAGYLVDQGGRRPEPRCSASRASHRTWSCSTSTCPGVSGFQVCEAIRTRSRVPVMMLTVRGEEEDLVRALELGADDYLNKPFSPRTLLARIKALLRRAGMESSAPLAAGAMQLDLEEHTVRIGAGAAGAPHQARAAPAADAAGQRRPHA